MKTVRVIGTSVLLLLLGAVAPTYAQQEQDARPPKQEQKAKPEKQQQARPEKQQQAKPARQEQQAKPERQQQAKGEQEQQQKQQQEARSTKREQQQEAKSQQEQTKSHNEQQVKATRQDQEQQARGQRNQQPEQAQGKWAQNGQKDSRGHEYTESRFGPQHHARFEEHGGRYYNGRREYSYGGDWFYAAAYPAWFYQRDVYFTMGADGLWYAVAYGDPSLTFQVYIE